ncbi:TIGR02757 family protein [Campylobacter vicugnae]|uniref:TIGR02757 family protein n=1 Tax=Campylobacter vicugnae TaxID=1660076 RepID=UPI000A34DEC4|nr:TIGR02757 family protein [Campylobacter sp. RM8970]
MNKLKLALDDELSKANTISGLYSAADPLQIATKYKTDPFITLVCALFAYGNARAIVKFLSGLEFDILNLQEQQISDIVKGNGWLYRFQNPMDVEQIFITIARAKRELDLESIIANKMQDGKIIYGINALIKSIYKLNNYRSSGYEFFWGREFENEPKSPYKRYNMWLRWMVRDSDIDLGLFKNINKSNLILPLDTHTHKVAQAIGLCSRKSYDYKAAKQITDNLFLFDPNDPIKYDFALYRIGQSGNLQKFLERIKG